MKKRLVLHSAFALAATALLIGLAGCAMIEEPGGAQSSPLVTPASLSQASPLQTPTTTPQWDGAHPPTPPTIPPELLTRVPDKGRHTPSATEIAAAATYMADRSRPYTPPPPKPEPSYPVKSLDDIPKVVLNNPSFQRSANDQIFGPNVKDAIPGKPLLVKSLDTNKRADYYVVPFYKNGLVSGVAIVHVKDGMGTMGGWGNVNGGKQFPYVSADEAKAQVEKAGHQVTGEPRLVYQDLLEGTNDFDPFWEISTTDGQTFYVVNLGDTIGVWNAADVHPIR